MAYFQKKHRTFTDEINNKLNEKRLFNQNMIDNTILGQLESTKLIYKDYNLDMDYIMRQRINEYQAARQQHYRQFVQGMIPTNIIRDLQELEEKQKQDKAAGVQQKEVTKSFMDQKVDKILNEQRENLERTIRESAVVPGSSLVQPGSAPASAGPQKSEKEEQRDEFLDELFAHTEAQIAELARRPQLSPAETLRLKRLRQEQAFAKLGNSAINTLLYLKMQNPAEFANLQHQRYKKFSDDLDKRLMDDYLAFSQQKKGDVHP